MEDDSILERGASPPIDSLTTQGGTQRRHLEHDIEVEDKRLGLELRREEVELDNVYRSCCLIIDRRAVLFFSQLSFSIFILGFSAWRLSRNAADEDCGRQHLYVGLLTLILGWWAPAPSIK